MVRTSETDLPDILALGSDWVTIAESAEDVAVGDIEQSVGNWGHQERIFHVVGYRLLALTSNVEVLP